MLTEVSFGDWLSRRRKAAGWTQEALAQQISCSTSALKKIEAEARRPSEQIVERLAEIFDIPSDQRTAFLRFARGDWKSAPESEAENAPWLTSDAHLQLATFLFTDIEGSAKLWENAPDRMKVALQRHHQIMQEAITSSGGTVFQIIGDAFCAAFPTVLTAVAAAVKAQQELYREEWDLPFPIRVRIGIHTGEAERTSNGNYASGPTLNRVARILSAAHGGQVLLSLATKDLVKDSLPANTELRDMGEHYLKNLMYPEHLFQLNIADLPSEFPPLNTLTHRHNLPVQVTSFIAREAEIALVHEYLSKDDIRLVTLIGPPGIGKTRLSIEVARASLHDFPDGVFFVALTLLDDPDAVPSGICQALGFLETGNSAPEDQLKENIGGKQMLIVLDNCEHLIEGMASLTSRLLSACPHVKLLATSRESLRIPGEWLYPVPAFDIPEESQAIDLGNASTYPALMLFIERARAVRPDFKLTADNIQTVAEICAHLDGLPFVIELIAARMRLMSPQALLERLSGQFVLTADGMRAPSERQKTLQNAIAWSYNLLSNEEQNLFARLSVFSGGFTLEAAESIFSPMMTNKPVPDLVALLLDKSLLQRAHDEAAEPRFSMLLTVHHFASNQLLKDNNETETRNGHLAYFLDLAEQADKEIHGPKQVEWSDRLEVELDNFRAALDWSLSNHQTDVALRLINALCWPWFMRTHYSEIRSWFEKLHNLPEISAQPALYARLLNFMGHMNWLLVNYREAESFLKESQGIWLKLGPTGERGLAESLSILGMVAFSGTAGLQAAQSLLEQSFELYEKHADQWGMAFDLLQLGWVAVLQNQDTSAFALLEKSMTLFEQLGDIWGKSRALHSLGELFLRQGNYEKARSYFEQNLEFDEEIKVKPGIVIALASLGDLYRRQQDYVQARQYYEKSLAISRTYGMKEDWGLSLYFLGLLALHQNNYSAARGYFVDYIRAERESLNKVNSYICVLSQAAISAGTNQPERAARLSGAAHGLVETLEYQISPFNQAEFDRHIHIAREQLGADSFENLAYEGRAMTTEQAVAYALEDQIS